MQCKMSAFKNTDWPVRRFSRTTQPNLCKSKHVHSNCSLLRLQADHDQVHTTQFRQSNKTRSSANFKGRERSVKIVQAQPAPPRIVQGCHPPDATEWLDQKQMSRPDSVQRCQQRSALQPCLLSVRCNDAGSAVRNLGLCNH